jgi:hypothetical protein
MAVIARTRFRTSSWLAALVALVLVVPSSRASHFMPEAIVEAGGAVSLRQFGYYAWRHRARSTPTAPSASAWCRCPRRASSRSAARSTP